MIRRGFLVKWFDRALAKAAQDAAYLTYAYNIRYSADLDAMFGSHSYGQDYGL